MLDGGNRSEYAISTILLIGITETERQTDQRRSCKSHMLAAIIATSHSHRQNESCEVEGDVKDRHENVGNCQIDDENIRDRSHSSTLKYNVTHH